MSLKCPICANPINEGARKCLHCGTWIDGSSSVGRFFKNSGLKNATKEGFNLAKNTFGQGVKVLGSVALEAFDFAQKGWTNYHADKDSKIIKESNKEKADGMPQWARELPEYLRPSPDQIHRLENLRNQIGINNSEFFMHISSHPETTRRLQLYLYNHVKKQDKSASEQDILKALVMNRFTIATSMGSDVFELAKAGAVSDHAFDLRLHEIVENYPSLEALTNAIIQDDKDMGLETDIPTSPEFESAARRVTAILRDDS
jgi:hypothetical protein